MLTLEYHPLSLKGIIDAEIDVLENLELSLNWCRSWQDITLDELEEMDMKLFTLLLGPKG